MRANHFRMRWPASLCLALIAMACAHDRTEETSVRPAPLDDPKFMPSQPRLALLVVYRPLSIAGTRIGSSFANVHLRVNGEYLGELGSNDIAWIEAPPGSHRVDIESAYGKDAVIWPAGGGITTYVSVVFDQAPGPRLVRKGSGEGNQDTQDMSIRIRKRITGKSAPPLPAPVPFQL